MKNPFKNLVRGLDSPALQHFIVPPADGVDLDPMPRVVKVIAAGDLAIRDSEGRVVIYPVAAGELLQFSARGIEATGTTATVAGWL